MANGVFHTVYGIEINLTRPDLGHPDRPGLLAEITAPVDRRDRELLECLQRHREGRCEAEERAGGDGEDRSPWMHLRRNTVGGRTTWVAAHLPLRRPPTAEQDDRRKALQERIARAADRHGCRYEVGTRAGGGRARTDVLVTGPGGLRIGWAAPYAPVTAETVRRRSRSAAEHGIVPLWVTCDERAPLIDRAPWARVDDLPWQRIASRAPMAVRAGVRHLQQWKCLRGSARPCPLNGSWCGRLHTGWYLPALCLPGKPPTEVDELVGASAAGELVPMRVPLQSDAATVARMWVPAADRDRWRETFAGDGPDAADPGSDTGPAGPAPDAGISYACEELDPVCRYGEEDFAYDDPHPRARPRRGPRHAHPHPEADAVALHTHDTVPERLLTIPRQVRRGLVVTPEQRRRAATVLDCHIAHVGPCAGCGTPIDRYGPRGTHACAPCRARVLSRR
ncbi:hypothetical protein HUT16_02335 [Kitasatospora sp. NA04385]|uniref:hypothetical protein n=1 Tax=Kitasatospora sp. NA04385 TaxID=2742135 RepID=UPI001592ACF8|nr:hypothetical protein [Kitasatospora sp. NA04385]QKW18055.1 hypothetical protein HUT16_02335 [Kitasatospora sp. NA04385]